MIKKPKIKKATGILKSALLANSKYMLLVIVLMIVPILFLPLVLLSTPSSIIAMDDNQLKSQMVEAENDISLSLTETLQMANREAILCFLNEEYALSNDPQRLIDLAGQEYLYCDDDDCIQINFYPYASQLAPVFCAYINAVDSTIEELGVSDETISSDTLMQMENVTTFNEDGEIVFNDDFAKQLKTDETDDALQHLSEFLKNETVFIVADDSSWLWTIQIEKGKSVAVKNEFSVYYQENIIDGCSGTISIPVFYNLSAYRSDELKNIEGRLGEDADLLQQLIQLNYDNYFASYSETTEDKILDLRNRFYASLIAQGVFLYNSSYGVDVGYLVETACHSETLKPVIDGIASDIWRTIGQLRNNGELSTNASRYSCTDFANYWFYCHYNQGHCLYGDGKDMVNSLMQSAYGRQHFRLSFIPSAGALFSISSSESENGHVGCVDGVDFEKGIIVISHGNYGSRGAIILRQQMTFDEFAKMVEGFGKEAKVLFANPIKESFESDECPYLSIIQPIAETESNKR